jgi:hypothetical protein
MSNANEEAAVNAMAAQVVYGDDELREDMKVFILDTVKDALGSRYDPTLADRVGNLVIVNRAREIEKIVARYLTNKLQGDQY